MFVRVALNIPKDKTFFYAVPEALEKEATTGKRVFVPFGRRTAIGFILEQTSCADIDNIKEISELPDREPLFTEDDLRFYRWVSQYYLYPLGKTLFDLMPTGSGLKIATRIMPVKGDGAAAKEVVNGTISDVCRMIVENVKNFPLGISIEGMQNLLGGKDISKEIETLRKRGLLIVDRCYSSPVRPKTEKTVLLSVNHQDRQKKPLSDQQQQMVNFLADRGVTLISLLREYFKNASYLVDCLHKKGIIQLGEQEVYRLLTEPTVAGGKGRSFLLNGHQESAVREISQGLMSRSFSPYLLHGVTGSGKTEVYLTVMEKAQEEGGGAIYLVPEIGLTPQLLSRVRERFGGQEIAIIHSGIAKHVRYDQWRRIQQGKIKIVIGARSALFVPMSELRLIIVDEEHDASYKQDERLRYNARDLAIVKAKMYGAAVVLGSATPAVQTYFNARNKKYHYLALPHRIENRAMPTVEIVDMRIAKEKGTKMPILSREMIEAIGQTLAEKNQTLLFLNRRGFNTVVLCTECGFVFRCPNCDLVLTYHAVAGLLRCHFCDYSLRAFPSCPNCRGSRIASYGVGTEKLEEEIIKTFPHARVGRMDSDTTARRGESEKILKALEQKKIDILVGTQMITKGHDFPNITLVGVVSADLSLNVPDFRAGERTFQILTQVAGRGGRGHTPGRVLVQTFNPDHYSVKRAQTHDYQGFYRDEIELRRNLSYPPYTRLVNLHINSLRKGKHEAGIDNIAKLVKDISLGGNGNDIEILGPAESPIAKIKGRYRWQILLKGKDMKAQIAAVCALRAAALKLGLEVKVDVDPMNFM